MAAPARVPVTIVAGFLGSGKTSLLNRLVAEHPDRFAIIVNEAGEVALDGRLVVGTRESIIELRDGCVCCTVRGDLAIAVAKLLDRRRSFFGRVRFDHILVECSGVASPGPVVQTFLVDSRLSSETLVDGVVVLASAADLPRQLAEEPLASEQIAYADLAIVNHADRGDPSAATHAIQQINPSVSVLSAVRAEVPVAGVLDLGGHLPERWAMADGRQLPAANGEHSHEPAHVPTHVTLSTTTPIDLGKLKLFLQFLAARRAWTLLRLKGIVHCSGQRRAVVAHGIYQWLEIGPSSLRTPEVSYLLVVGRGMDIAEVQRGWAAVIGV